MRKSTIFWGIVLVLLGGLLLLSNLGIITINVWGLFFAALLILLGIWILIGRFWKGESTQHVTVPLSGASRGIVRFKHGAGKLIVTTGMDSSNLVEGEFNQGLQVKSEQRGDALDVELSLSDWGFPWFGNQTLDWSVTLPRDVPIELYVDSGANDARFDLTEAQVTLITLHSGASSTRINLPSHARYTQVAVETGAASVALSVPQGVAARISGGATLGSMNIDKTRFPPSGDGYRSPDYDSAANKVDIRVQTGVGSIDIN